ncbi:hypothetical protein JXE04_04090 [Patescibacteria group bacterium]|nr:hypothetical protein [Patescibacteria group bacterium]
MFKTISQIVILIVFLFLTIFVTVWFDDTGGKEENIDSRQSLSWLTESVKITGSVLAIFLPHESDVKINSNNFDVSISEYIDDASSSMNDVAGMYNNVSDSASDFINSPTEDNEFREFVGSIMQKAPGYYLDMKMYNNAWKNFWSFYWLEFNKNNSE